MMRLMSSRSKSKVLVGLEMLLTGRDVDGCLPSRYLVKVDAVPNPGPRGTQPGRNSALIRKAH